MAWVKKLGIYLEVTHRNLDYPIEYHKVLDIGGKSGMSSCF